MKPDPTEQELLRLAGEVDAGREVDWEERSASDPALTAGIRGLRDIEALAAALGREPEPPDPAAPPRAWLEPGATLGRYPVECEAGRGGMGVVYLARDLVLERPVALKLLPPDVARSPERLERFTAEARLLASLNHPNVATIHGLEESGGHRFLVLEWVAGETVAARLGRGALPVREALEVCGQVARGLAAAHAGGVIHRDLKPGNVMVTPQGQVKVLDFGLARRGGPPRNSPAWSGDPRIAGTWGYVSPECLTREEDHRADVFAFGCVLYECLAGVPAFSGDDADSIRAALLEREPDEARLPADTPPAIRRLIAACVVKDPDRRLGSMGEALRTIEAALERRTAPGPARSESARAVPHRLPAETDAFVGREDELRELAERFRRGTRLVTLQGPGGMGKTRLALRYGWRSLEEWPGGVWFCDLTEARSRDGVVAAVAQALGVPLGAADPVLQLGHAIAGRGRCLLILDNFEQVVAFGAATVAPWLARAADAHFVVTSREALELPGEGVRILEPLEDEPAVELFVERARAHRPGFELDGPGAASAKEIVRLVEGMPLAIELAAARIRVMSPVQIVERMRERFRLLAGTAGGRHGTIRAAIDGSWELLSAWERSAFAQCAVFDGGFTLAAAEAVLDLGEWQDAPWIPDVIQDLVSRSLLRAGAPGRESGDAEPELRFGMFVSMHEYARGKLAELGAMQAAAEQRHGEWYARSGSEDEIATLYRPGGAARRRRLGRDLDNLVAAARRAAARADGDMASAAYRAAWDVLQLRGPSGAAADLGRDLLVSLSGDERRRLILTTLGYAELRSGRIPEARAHLEAALALHRAAGDRRWEEFTLGNLGALHSEQGRSDDGRAHLLAALAITRELQDRRREGIEIARLSVIDHEQGRFEQALSGMESALTLAREMGDRNLEGQVLGHRGTLHLELGRTGEARAHFEQAIEIAREVGNRRFEGIMLSNLGDLGANAIPVEEARTHLESSLVIAREVGSRSAEGHALMVLGKLHLDHGQPEQARGPLEAALEILRELGERRYEGFVLGELGRLHLEQDRLEEARTILSQGERILREIEARLVLADLHGTRCELELRAADLVAARGILGEVETLVGSGDAGPDSDVGRKLSKIRQALAAKP